MRDAARKMPPTRDLSVAEQEERLRVAYHEAGHAVTIYGLLSARGPKSAEICDDTQQEVAGLVHTETPTRDDCGEMSIRELIDKGGDLLLRAVIRDLGVLCYSGVAASFPKATGMPQLGWHDSRGDREIYERQCKRLGVSRPADLWDWPAWEEAKRVVDACWGAIECVAAALYETGELCGKEIAGLIGSSPCTKNCRPSWRE